MESNVLVVHGGGPTAVMNASLYGVIMEAKKHPEIGAVYGAIGGMEGILKEQLFNLSDVEQEKLDLLLKTPGTAIGSSRYPMTEEDYERTPEILAKYRIKYLLPNGGNGTMDTCGKIYKACLNPPVRADGDASRRYKGVPFTFQEILKDSEYDGKCDRPIACWA